MDNIFVIGILLVGSVGIKVCNSTASLSPVLATSLQGNVSPGTTTGHSTVTSEDTGVTAAIDGHTTTSSNTNIISAEPSTEAPSDGVRTTIVSGQLSTDHGTKDPADASEMTTHTGYTTEISKTKNNSPTTISQATTAATDTNSMSDTTSEGPMTTTLGSQLTTLTGTLSTIPSTSAAMTSSVTSDPKTIPSTVSTQPVPTTTSDTVPSTASSASLISSSVTEATTASISVTYSELVTSTASRPVVSDSEAMTSTTVNHSPVTNGLEVATHGTQSVTPINNKAMITNSNTITTPVTSTDDYQLNPISNVKTTTMTSTEAHSTPLVTSPSQGGSGSAIEISSMATSSTCPRFRSRLEDDTRIITYDNDRCQMTVTVETETVSPVNILQLFKSRIVRRPRVTFQAIKDDTMDGTFVCKPLSTSLHGDDLFVDTDTDRCQMILKIQKVTSETVPTRVSESNSMQNTTKFVPVLTYSDDNTPNQEPV